jgi:hypothetical protein
MWPQGGNRVKRNGEKVTETVTDLFFFRNDRFWPEAAAQWCLSKQWDESSDVPRFRA